MVSYALTLALSVALGQAQTPPATGATNRAEQRPQQQKIDGQWQVVYIEMDGKRVEDKNFGNVKIEGNKLTCKHDGKEKSWKLEFGPHHRVRAEETTANQPASNTPQTTSREQDRHSHGVYIASKEFLCFSMNHGRDTTGGTGRDNPAPGGGAATGVGSSDRDHGAYGSHFVLVLRRGGTASGTDR